MKTRYHVAWSVEVDQLTDAQLRADVIPGMRLPGGERPTVDEVRRLCAAARERGFEVLPRCDDHDERGMCRGHAVEADEARVGAAS